MKNWLFAAFFVVPFLSYSQGSTGINTFNPSTKAALDIKSYGKQGVMLPRLNASDTLTIAPGLNSNMGLAFYDTLNSKFWYWSGLKWLSFGNSTPALSTVNSWLLNGNTLTPADTSSTGFVYIGTNNLTPLIFATNGQQRMRIGRNGRVGIGTNSLSDAFIVHVNNFNEGITLKNPFVGDYNIAFTASSNLQFSSSVPMEFAPNGAGVVLHLDDGDLITNTNVTIKNLIGPGVVTANASGLLGIVAGTPVVGVGVANKIPFWNGAGNALSTNANFHWDNVNSRLGIGTVLPTTKLHIISATSPAIRIQDGTEGVDKVLVSDANGNGHWDVLKSTVKFSKRTNLNVTSTTATNTYSKLSDFLTFTKLNAGTFIEVNLNSVASSGTFAGGAFAVKFEIRIDDVPLNVVSAVGTIRQTNTEDFIGLYGVYTGPAGSHTLSVWVMALPAGGTSSGIMLDPGGFQGNITVKETW